MRSNCPTTHAGKSLFNETDVLSSLYDPYVVLTAFCLDGNHVVATSVVEPDVEFVDLDLPRSVDSGAKMVLKAIGREAEKRVDQAIIPDNRQQRLLIVEA